MAVLEDGCLRVVWEEVFDDVHGAHGIDGIEGVEACGEPCDDVTLLL
jgi:hypothetical protein